MLAKRKRERREKRGTKSNREDRKMAEEGTVIACHAVEEWTRQLEQANESKKLVLFLDCIFVFLSLFFKYCRIKRS
jgi:hypothetical protein